MAHDSKDQRTLAAIMFTDMVGYSTLAQRNETLALELLEEHRRLVRPLFVKHGGREIKTIGDAFMVEFASPVEAARCAIAMQQCLHEHNARATPERQLRIRIGLHLGDVVHREGDVYGDGVNIAARIEPLAESGGICLTQQVYDHVHNKLDTPLVKLGDTELKNIATPVCLYRVVLPWELNKPVPKKRQRFEWRPGQLRWAVAMLILVALGLTLWQWPVRHARRGTMDRIESLAVMPVASASNDPDQKNLADGMTELLTTELGKISSLSVRPSLALSSVKQRERPFPEWAAELKVDARVESRVFREGQRFRITARLIHAPTSRQLWQTTYTRSISNIFDLQGEVALALADAMKVKLETNEQAQLSASRPTVLARKFR